MMSEMTQTKEKKSELASWIRFIAFLFILFVIFKFVIGFTVVHGDSMNPTFKHEDILLTKGVFNKYERNDIVLFRDDAGYTVVKRIVGVPNDEIEIINGVVYLNGEMIDEDYTTGTSFDIPKTIVEEGTYFVMGDNREPGASKDSRSDDVGLVPESQIESEVLLSLIPFGTKK
ncbi:signal peptidase I Serine peptidase. MEROPS family S26A [Ornithinibacillus halophilus]|uniref:Signal peptidase I n=2 Tax=Ornithinibacillus halophilus TaxID=930117 RepID=A0A1M5HL28_9BACI|nr:signal peptidase I Serine peptidase. MEROPS family S26A [Ornithinibacillus halophilus]